MKNNLILKYSKIFLTVFLFAFVIVVNGQQKITLAELTDMAINGNYQNTINNLEVQKAEWEGSGSAYIPKTGIFLENEEMQPGNPGGEWKLGISQDIPWPGLNKARRNYTGQMVESYRFNSEAIRAELRGEVKKSYFELLYLTDKKKLYQQLDSIYSTMADAAVIRYNVGEVAGLEKISAESKYKETHAILRQIDSDILEQQYLLMILTNSNEFYLPYEDELTKIELEESLIQEIHPSLLATRQNIEVAESLIEVQKNENKPDFSASFFSQSYLGISQPKTGFMVSVALPIFGTRNVKDRIKALETDVDLKKAELQWKEMNLNNQKERAYVRVEKEQLMLDYYEDSGLGEAEAIISAASLSYRSGEISFAELSQYLTQAISIKQNYLSALNSYNQAVIEYEYLTGRVGN